MRIPISFFIVSVAVICMLIIFCQATQKADFVSANTTIMQEKGQP